MIELFPIIFFFILYNLSNIFYATFFTILFNLVLLLFFKIKLKKFNKGLFFSFLLILFFGGATILLKDEFYIKLKTTIMYWLFGSLCLLTYVLNKTPFLKLISSFSMDFPSDIWINLNRNCGYYFIFMGGINLYIAYNYNTNVWVNFKFFGTLIISFIFMIIQYFFLFKNFDFSKNSKKDD